MKVSRMGTISHSHRPVAGQDPAVTHRKTREARAVEVAHDYVEVISDLIKEGGEARLVEIARRLGVSHVTANRTVARLQRQGLVVTERYRSIFLTKRGEAIAEEVRHKHTVVLQFLMSLGVPEKVAMVDAEGIEHHVGAETLKAFERALESGGHVSSRKQRRARRRE